MGLTSLGMKQYGKIIDINHGQFNQRLQDGEDAPQGTTLTVRELTAGPNQGKEVREARANALPNNIMVGAEFADSKYGSNLILNLVDEDETRYDLQIKVDSQFFGQFVKRIPNLDLDKTVSFILGKSKDGKAFMFLQQDGVTVKSAYTKDNPNGMPPPVLTEHMGKESWSWEDQESFLYNKAKEFINTLKESNQDIEPTEEIPF
jgi:hypothetical protein|tara:strand:+ start:104 stop:715 length:612 start_codon:yes stop_codon:yes gene_type:complete